MKDLDPVLIYYKTVRAKKSTQGKNKIQKNEVNSLLNTVNEMNSHHGKLRKSAAKSTQIDGARYVKADFV